MAVRKEDSAAVQKDQLSSSSQPPAASSNPTHATPATGVPSNYASKSWRGKAAAVAGVARESISAAATVSKKPSAPQSTRSQTLLSRSKASPSAASTTPLNATSSPGDTNPAVNGEIAPKDIATTDQAEMDQATRQERDGAAASERPLPAAGWKGWWSKTAEDSIPISSDINHDQPTTASAQTHRQPHDSQSQPETQLRTERGFDKAEKAATSYSSSDSRSSWFGLWRPGADGDKASAPPTNCKSSSSQQTQYKVEAASDIATKTANAANTVNATSGSSSHSRTASGSWTFWSRERAAVPEDGHLAVANTPSESDPQPAKLLSDSPVSGTNAAAPKKRKAQEETASRKPSTKLEKATAVNVMREVTSESPNALDEGEALHMIEKVTEQNSKSSVSNLILPRFRATYQLAYTPSYWQQLIRMFGRGSMNEQRHLSIVPTPHKFKRAIAIGVHGYFPSPIVQKILGQPTGTSVRFANNAAAAIEKWAKTNGNQCEVEKVALEGEGMIANRLDTLWKLLLNWVDKIRHADYILVACHSQGVPVGVMLVAKLIEFGCLDSNARIGICGMAGVNLGPFASYKSRFLDSSASELFDFCNPTSLVSTNYSAALEMVLAHHVRVTYIGSIDDQLVSLESSTFSSVSHPYIYRAVFVNGKIHAPDFLTHLVGFALKLRNLGLSDHGLMRELSMPLAGSLYTGDGHSRIYEDSRVYDLAVEFSLETTSLGQSIPVHQRHYEVPSAKPNPFYLPWAMRGLLEEEFVRTELKGETEELLRQFDSWKPQSAVLKDVKFRLEAVKSKL